MHRWTCEIPIPASRCSTNENKNESNEQNSIISGTITSLGHSFSSIILCIKLNARIE